MFWSSDLSGHGQAFTFSTPVSEAEGPVQGQVGPAANGTTTEKVVETVSRVGVAGTRHPPAYQYSVLECKTLSQAVHSLTQRTERSQLSVVWNIGDTCFNCTTVTGNAVACILRLLKQGFYGFIIPHPPPPTHPTTPHHLQPEVSFQKLFVPLQLNSQKTQLFLDKKRFWKQFPHLQTPSAPTPQCTLMLSKYCQVFSEYDYCNFCF